MSGLSIATNILKTLETSSSIGMFARDTGGCLTAKLGLSRSKDEAIETSIAEVSESALFYFSTPALAKLTSNIFSKAYNVNKDQFTSNIKDLTNLPPETLKKIKLGKFGQIMTTFGLILPAVFAIAPIRNMVTLSESGKEKFVSVVELDGKHQKTKQRDKAKEKSINLIKKLALTSLGIMGATAAIIAASKNKNFYEMAEKGIDKVIKLFDFKKSGDLEMLHYGALIYPVSIASYFYASRDKYEKQENARRFSITVPLMFFGEKLIQNPIHKYTDKIFNTNVYESNSIKSYDEIMKLTGPMRDKMLKSKNIAYGLTFFINTMAIAAGIALLNRIETKRKYNQEHQKQFTTFFVPEEEKEIWKAIKI